MSATYKGPDGKEVELPFIDPTRNGAFVAFLCSEHADYVSGQIFGTGGERVVILEQPSYGNAMYKDGGWGVTDLVEKFEQHMKKELEPIGLMKSPYPFLDGVKPPAS
jgi:3-oxoacyl-[acyl-carrier protein] reductase